MVLDNSPIVKVKSGNITQLKKLLELKYSFIEASLITEILYFCKKSKTESIVKTISPSKNCNFSFTESIKITKQPMIKYIKNITSGNNPPIFKKKYNKSFLYSINIKFFNEIYNNDFRNISEIFKRKKLTQDRFLCYLYGWGSGIILNQLLYWNEKSKDSRMDSEIRDFTISDFAKELFMSRQTFVDNLNKIAFNPTDDLIDHNFPVSIYILDTKRETELMFENIKKDQIKGLRILSNQKVYNVSGKRFIKNVIDNSIKTGTFIETKTIPLVKKGIIRHKKP